MKVKSFLVLAILIISVAGLKAQGFQLGLKGGANFYEVQGRSFDQEYRFGYNIGGFAQLDFSKHFGIQPEIMWNEYQTRTADDASLIYTDLSNGQDIQLNYLTVPVLLAFKPTKFLTIHLGPQYGILINQTQTLVTNVGNAFKKGDLSIVGGVQLNAGWFKLGLRYTAGLNNMDNVGNVDSWKNQGFQAYLGVRII
jgi:hypothetical protein